MPRSLPALIFDLDGTLTASKGLDARRIDDAGPRDRFVGPPVEEWAVQILPHGSEEERIALARDYRACYDREGWKNNSVYAGVGELLTQLRAQGFPLYVCTSKQQHFAVRILEAFHLAAFFTAIYGDKAEYASHSKVDLMARLLSEQSIAPASAWMIGDRIYDIDAARGNRVRCLAAGWGYGTAEEYAQADALASTPADVARLVCA